MTEALRKKLPCKVESGYIESCFILTLYLNFCPSTGLRLFRESETNFSQKANFGLKFEKYSQKTGKIFHLTL